MTNNGTYRMRHSTISPFPIFSSHNLHLPNTLTAAGLPSTPYQRVPSISSTLAVSMTTNNFNWTYLICHSSLVDANVPNLLLTQSPAFQIHRSQPAFPPHPINASHKSRHILSSPTLKKHNDNIMDTNHPDNPSPPKSRRRRGKPKLANLPRR